MTCGILAKDFKGSSDYVNIKTPFFRKTRKAETNLIVEIFWKKKRSLYIDRICGYDQYFADLYINSTSARTTIGDQLDSYFPSTRRGDSRFTQLYLDEPAATMYRAIATVDTIAQSKLGTGKYVNGATRGLRETNMKIINAQRRLPYYLYDTYPIIAGTSNESTGSNNLQEALQYNLIYKFCGYFDEDNESNYDYSGIKSAIKWAQNFNTNPSDDRPLYPAIQVQGEYFISGNAVARSGYRTPAPNEILVQGWLSLCYGAKGIMYYCVMTNTPAPSNPDTILAQYGLFDRVGYHFQDASSTITNVCQDPAAAQEPNDRFYAVKKLNGQIDKISSEILQLTWKNGYSLHNSSSLTGEIISNISARYGSSGVDLPAETFVELGIFKKTSDYTNPNLDYFILVNRRCLTTEGRTIFATLNKSTSTKWKITEVGTNNYWIVSGTGTFSAYFEPGTGKLFKLEPFSITNNMHLNGNLTIYDNFTIPSGTTVYVDTNAVITMPNSTPIIVNGTLSSNGTASKRIVYNFTSSNPYPENGIIINQNGSASISYCTVKNAWYGVK